MAERPEHHCRACSVHDPWLGRLLIALGVSIAVTTSLMIGLQTLWGLLGYVPWLVTLGGLVRWEIIHRPSTMYVRWRPREDRR